MSDAGLAHFKECENLTSLNLAQVQVSDAGLAHFQDCKNLAQLNLIETLVSDAGLAHFQDCKNLTDLRLDLTQVSDAALNVLAGFPNLTTLNLTNSRISLRGHEQLKADLPWCQINWSETNRSVAESVLALGGTVEIGSRDKPETRPIQFPLELPAAYFQVRHVSLVGVTKPLGNLPELFAYLRFPEFDRLERLDLSGIPLPEGYNYGYLAPIHGLRDLSLGYPMLTDQKFHYSGLLKQVKRLSLAGSGLTDAGIKPLADLTNLESLDLRRTKVTAVGIDGLEAALPGCKIEWDGGVIEPVTPPTTFE